MINNALPDWLTLPQAAKKTGYTRGYIYLLIQMSRIDPADTCRAGKTWLISKAGVEKIGRKK
jgi:hypothetical protein